MKLRNLATIYLCNNDKVLLMYRVGSRLFKDSLWAGIGMDMPKPDNYPFEIHKLLFNNDIFIIENLTNLDKLKGVDNFQVIAFPLRIKAEASVVRAVAMY